MCRLFIITISILCSHFALAQSNYQIDLIIFAHPQNAAQIKNADTNSPFIPINKNAITLKKDANTPYSLLPASKSKLADEYYRLNHKSSYQVLGHYSWIQSASNQQVVALPQINNKGWQVQGTIQVRQGSYYSFDADLQCSPPSNPQSSFTISQKQRLKGNSVYYLDHAQISMLVKVHKLS